ncbi:uncharacterized protein (DUF488 family) [Bradyrhizobium sp. USDA 4341]
MTTNSIATIGYEKTNPEEFLNALRRAEIDTLVDIRDVGFSHKPGFSTAPLRNAMEQASIAYWHLKDLGNPKPGRVAAKSGNRQLFHALYEGVLSGTTGQLALDLLADRSKSRRLCLMCFERDHANCHRDLVAGRLAARGIEIAHLLPVRTVPETPRERQGILL